MHGPTTNSDNVTVLQRFIEASRRLVVLTGAGCSTESGIPDYRAADGSWKRREPIRIGEFTGDELARRRYWARSFAGWPEVASAAPNAAHEALAQLEATGSIHYLITQNVDGLHQAAGSRKVVNLHGRLSRVVCLDCGDTTSRDHLQSRLEASNPNWRATIHGTAPDGDADVEASFSDFEVPACALCEGMLKPDVVFFGENVPYERVRFAMARVEEADALLVVGSSLMVWSGFRFARAAARRGAPIAIVNIGATRADDIATLKIEHGCSAVLSALVNNHLGQGDNT